MIKAWERSLRRKCYCNIYLATFVLEIPGKHCLLKWTKWNVNDMWGWHVVILCGSDCIHFTEYAQRKSKKYRTFNWPVSFSSSCEKSPTLIKCCRKCTTGSLEGWCFASFPLGFIASDWGTNVMHAVNNGKLYFCHVLHAELIKVSNFHSNKMLVFPRENM